VSVTAPDLFSLSGTVLDGQYRVDAIIGEGGFGVVYKGWHLPFDQPIAIKALKIPPLSPQAQNDILAKFQGEARLLYTLSQASLNIVRSVGFGAATMPSGAWAPYIVLEWLEGRSLQADLDERRALRLGGRPLHEAMKLLEPAARGLQVAHHKRVAHRDIKPANIFLTRTKDDPPEDTVKVLDFGIAKVIEEGANAAGPGGTASAFTSFTWLYCAPEQFDPRHGPTGPWTDVFAFTLVLTEVITGKPPFEAEEAFAIMKEATDTSRRPTPRARGAVVPDAFEAACARALAVDPKARFPDMDELWEALSAAATTAVPPSGGAPKKGGTAMMPAIGSVPPTRAAPQAVLTPPPGTLPAVGATQGYPATGAATATPRPGTVPTPPPMPVPVIGYGPQRRKLVGSELHPVVWVVIIGSLFAIVLLGTCFCSAIHAVAK
jgi:serine/threonine protein kinase